jgi:hypothetical protein
MDGLHGIVSFPGSFCKTQKDRTNWVLAARAGARFARHSLSGVVSVVEIFGFDCGGNADSRSEGFSDPTSFQDVGHRVVLLLVLLYL